MRAVPKISLYRTASFSVYRKYYTAGNFHSYSSGKGTTSCKKLIFTLHQKGREDHKSGQPQWLTSSSSTSLFPLKILSINIRSLLPNINDLSILLSLTHIDIICICETWLSPDIISSELSLPGFTLFRADRSRTGGGVAIYARSSLNPVLHSLPHNSLELCSIGITHKGFKLTVSCFYRPPTASADVDTLIDILSSQGPFFLSRLIIIL